MPIVTPGFRAAPLCEPMEPRVLYSADAAPVVLTAEVGQAFVQLQDSRAPATLAPGIAVAEDATTAAPRELVVLDARVPQADELIEALNRQRANGRSLDVLVIEEHSDGISQISSWLEQAVGRYDAVHVLAHGESGAMQVGSSTLDLNAVRAQATQISAWGHGLSADADLLLYGCDLAAERDGRELVDALAALTGADVAASIDATGHSSLGGDWALEYRQGSIEASSVLDAAAQFRWQGLLATSAPGAGVDAIVNTTTGGAQQTIAGAAGRQVAVNLEGATVVVWRDESATANGEIRARLFDINGVAVSSEILVSSDSSKTQTEPSVAIDANGNFVVVWTQGNGADGDGKGIYGRTFDSAGNATSTEFIINSVTSEDEWLAQVAINPNTASSVDFYVTWTRYFNLGGSNGVQAAAFQWDGTEVIDEYDVNQTGANDQQNSSIAYSSNGTALIVWQSLNQDGDGWGIYGQRLSATGALSGGEFRINTTTTNDQLNPDVSADGSGNFVVVWSHDVGGATGFDVVGQRIDATGSKIGGEFVVSQTTARDQTNAAVAMRADGRYVVTWQSRQQDSGPTEGIYAREFRPNGQAAGDEFLVNTTVAGDQVAPSISYAGDRAVIVWSGNSDSSTPTDSDGVFMRLLSVVTPRINVTQSGSQTDENGATTVGLNVSLNAAPIGDVVVSLAVTDASEASIGGSGALTFNASNWSVAQSVVVTGVDDTVVDGDMGYVVQLSSTSSQADFDSMTAATASISNLDDDTFNRVVVDTNAATVDGDTSSIAALLAARGADGKISLAEAIRAANATTNPGGQADHIDFDLSAAAGYRINLSAALDAITDAVVIDGKTDPAYTGRPVVELSRLSGSFDGLTLAAGSAGSVIRGLAIHGLSGNGIVVQSANNVIEFNYVGVVPTTQTVNGNFQNGIVLRNGANGNVLTGNTIGGNSGSGVRIDSAHNNRLLGNFIGTDASGAADLHNVGDGVTLLNSATLNRVGGIVITESNRIAFNHGRAIAVGNFSGTSSSNSFVGNRIYGNAFGIDLDPSASSFSTAAAVTANDTRDTDAGPNGLQNAPVLTRADWSAGSVLLTVELDSMPAGHYRIEFFESASADASGHGQGARLIGFALLATDANGRAEATLSFALSGGPGAFISATATRTDSTFTNLFDTSEFSANGVAANTPIVLMGGTVPENSPAGAPAGNLTIAHTGSFNYVLLDDAGGRFEVDASTGALRVSAGTQLDHESAGSHTIMVRATNSAGVMRHDTLTIAVADVNEAPSIVAPNSVVTDEDLPVQLTLTGGNGIGLLDPDSTNGPMTVTVHATLGRISLASINALTFASGDGVDDEVVEFTGSLDSLRAALTNVQFSPLADASGAGALTIMIRDAGAPALADSHVIAVTVRAVNDAPTITAAGPWQIEAGLTAEIDAGALSVADIDNAAAALRYTITRSPDSGALLLDDLVLSTGAQFTQADVDSGRLSFRALGVRTVVSDSVGLSVSDGQRSVLLSIEVKVVPATVVGQQGSAGSGDSDAATLAKPGAAGRANASANSGATTAAALAPSLEGAAVISAPAASGTSGASGATSKGNTRPLSGFGSSTGSSGGDSATRSLSDSSDRRADSGQASASRTLAQTDLSRRFGLDTQGRRDGLASAHIDRDTAQTQTRSSGSTVTRQHVALRNELNRIRETIDERVSLERNVAASTATLTASASIGYVIWLLRGGVLLSSLLASVPAWVSLDPLPILSSAGGRSSDADDDDSLQEMLKKASAERARKAAAHADSNGDPTQGAEPQATKLPLRNPGLA